MSLDLADTTVSLISTNVCHRHVPAVQRVTTMLTRTRVPVHGATAEHTVTSTTMIALLGNF